MIPYIIYIYTYIVTNNFYFYNVNCFQSFSTVMKRLFSHMNKLLLKDITMEKFFKQTAMHCFRKTNVACNKHGYMNHAQQIEYVEAQ